MIWASLTDSHIIHGDVHLICNRLIDVVAIKLRNVDSVGVKKSENRFSHGQKGVTFV
jgi:hypothetical protein